MTDGIFLQNQVADGERVSMHPPKFMLAWGLNYDNGEKMFSEFTPRIKPSIEQTVSRRSDIASVSVYGHSTIGSFSLELARVDYKLVRKFGYIAEQYSSAPGKEHIIGIYIDIAGKRQIKVFRNGSVLEVSK